MSRNRKTESDSLDATHYVTHGTLSDPSSFEKGWKLLPLEKIGGKMNVYRIRLAQPEFDWVQLNTNKRLMEYDSGEKLAEFDNGRGRWFYKNGLTALDYFNAEELHVQQRCVVYSSGEQDERGRFQPYTLLASFDYMGNGVVFGHNGKIRLKYNQNEGVVLDRSIGPVSHWKWHSITDPIVLQQVMIDTQTKYQNPIINIGELEGENTDPDIEDMPEIDNFNRDGEEMPQSSIPFQIKMKALKINEHFWLKVSNQANVYLIFQDGSVCLKLNIGIVLDHREVVDIDSVVGDVSNNEETLPACTDSVARLQEFNNMQYYNRIRTKYDCRLRTSAHCENKLATAALRPMCLPLSTGPSDSSTTNANRYCKFNRKPPACNVYYSNA